MVTTALLTATDLARLPDTAERHELVKGRLRTMAPPGYAHGRRVLRLGRLLDDYARAHGGGEVAVEAGFLLAQNPDTVRAPDVAFVTAQRLPGEAEASGYFHGAPDLAVEVVSPGDTMPEVLEKVHEYLEAGCGLVWVVENRTKSITAYRPGGSAHVFRDNDELTAEDVLPGFRVRVADAIG